MGEGYAIDKARSVITETRIVEIHLTIRQTDVVTELLRTVFWVSVASIAFLLNFNMIFNLFISYYAICKLPCVKHICAYSSPFFLSINEISGSRPLNLRKSSSGATVFPAE